MHFLVARHHLHNPGFQVWVLNLFFLRGGNLSSMFFPGWTLLGVTAGCAQAHTKVSGSAANALPCLWLRWIDFVVLGVLRQRYQHCLVLHGLAMIQNLCTWFLLSVRCLHWVLASLDWGPTGILGCWPGMIQRTRCPCMSWHGWCWDMLGTYFPAVWFLAIKTISLVRELSFLCKLRLLQQS